MIQLEIEKLIQTAEEKLIESFKEVDKIAFFNQKKVLTAFQKNKISLRHFQATTGYGYDDVGRDTLGTLFADVFNAESAIVSPQIVSGTHALTLALFGISRPNDSILSISGTPYDTLEEVIHGKGNGSLADFGVSFETIDLKNDDFDLDAISMKLKSAKKPFKIIYLQRSRGYAWRNALSIDSIKRAIDLAKELSPSSIVMVDNCYGEFVETIEPTDVGADVIIGSLIKNPGGGIAPTGAYIAGKKEPIELISYRLTAPSIGCEVGSYTYGYQLFYQGLFLSPHVVAQAIKGAKLVGQVMLDLGYDVLPKPTDTYHDIITSIKFDTDLELIHFIQGIQFASPVDSYVTPEPWDMPGYESPVIMAAGCFVQGASIELSADSPIRAPYVAYMQGGLTYEHVKLALMQCLKSL